jgi:hypothetical protein
MIAESSVGNLVKEESYLKVYHNKENNIITAQWIGFLKPEDVREGCEYIDQQIRKHNITNHISDQRKLKILSKDVQEYLVGECFPMWGQSGLKKIAVFVSSDLFAKVSVDKVNQNAIEKAGFITFGTFDKHEDCVQWLSE